MDLPSKDAASFDSTTPANHALFPSHPGHRRLKGKKRVVSSRKYGPTQMAKRQKLMGRPRNEWTSTRLRKLVRLYLMTGLDVSEISRVLSAGDFQPCKRDIQKQLTNLLQPRPNLTRSIPHIMHARLRLLRECKTLRSLERTKGRSSERLTAVESVAVTSGRSCTFDSSAPDSPTARLELPSSAYPTPPTTIEALGPEDVRSDIPAELCELSEGSESSLGTDLATPFSPRRSSTLSSSLTEPTISRHAEPDSQPLEARSATAPSIAADTISVLSNSTGTKSKHSGISFGSLGKRLLSKYSPSFLGDVKSLLERLTISEGSEASISQPSIRAGKAPVSTKAPTRSKHAVILPGFFHRYCWEHINHNELRRCDDVTLPCDRGPIFRPLGMETHRTIRDDILFRIRNQSVRKDDLEGLDAFGNSVLHIAASLGASPSYLLSLVKNGADVGHLNNANQTFLHLICPFEPLQLEDFRLLFKSLVRRHFNFEQQDDNGQTVIHVLTGPSMDDLIITGVLQSLQFHGVEVPVSRDNLGFTVADQLRVALESRNLHDGMKLGEVSNGADQPPKSDIVTRLPDEIRKDDHILQAPTEEYELHAHLLREIVQAGELPLSEDLLGRNGLHCLAQVRFDLPVPGMELSLNSSTSSTSDSFFRRETYLDQLLVAGVDPNSHDKNGVTPLMSFIIHQRAEDDALMTRLLTRLFKAGAELNQRNRQGETALHIAVSLGNRAATKFLLSHGANVHARTGDGIGVIALGLKSSNKASHDEKLYAQILLCVSLIGSAGAVSAPTILHEWASPDFRILPDWNTKEASPSTS